MRFFKQKWVIVAGVVLAVFLVWKYALPALKGKKDTTAKGTDVKGAPDPTPAPGTPKKLAAPMVTYSSN